MESIRDSLFKIAEFVANLHFEGVSHRNISMNNLFVDVANRNVFYLTNYAQNDLKWTTHHSPEAASFRRKERRAYSTTKSDVWSFGCVLLEILGVDSADCIHRLNDPLTIQSPQEVERLLLSHLGISHRSQSKLICALRLLMRIFTAESRRCSMADVCCDPFFAAPFSAI